jgi:ribonuclease BN (tRNA processing enzyme)
VLFYNGESSFTKEVMELASGSDLFISTVVVLEPHSFHISPKDAGRAASEAGVTRLAVIHWPTEFEENRDEFGRLIRRYFEGEVLVPDDFTSIEV